MFNLHRKSVEQARKRGELLRNERQSVLVRRRIFICAGKAVNLQSQATNPPAVATNPSVKREFVHMKMKPEKQHTIVWADDDPDDLSIVREIIDSTDNLHQLKEAANGRQVIEYLHSVPCPLQLPCLVVLDINMPLLNGKETLTIIRSEERYKDITVVVFSTSSSEKDRLFCEKFGVRMYTKPSSYQAYQQVVAELLLLCPAAEMENSRLN